MCDLNLYPRYAPPEVRKSPVAPALVSEGTLKEGWRFLEEFPTAQKLHEAFAEIKDQIKPLFQLHERTCLQVQAEEDLLEKLRGAFALLRQHTVDPEVLKVLTETEKKVREGSNAKSEALRETTSTLAAKIGALKRIVDDFKLICSRGNVCVICQDRDVELAYGCGHFICLECDRKKTSGKCHLCSQIVDKRIRLYW